VDAEELFETLNVTTSKESTACADNCSVGACHLKCALEVIDDLLSTPDAVSGEEVDLLLDFRSLVRSRVDGAATLRAFCDLRRRLEMRHYLAFYRLRAWLRNHLVAAVSPDPGVAPQLVPIRLTYYCVEAIQRDCLCSALVSGKALIAPRMQFTFRSLVPVTQRNSGDSLTQLPGISETLLCFPAR
jgi:hypothetical protein